MSVDVKDVLNELYQQSLALGLASGLFMVLQKLMKISLGTPMSIRPFLMLSVSLGLGASLLKVIKDKWKIPSELYHNPGTGYMSIESLYRKVKNDGFDVSCEQVRDFLQMQDTYTKIFRKGGPGLGKKKYRRTIVGDLGQQLQLDLVDMTEIENTQIMDIDGF